MKYWTTIICTVLLFGETSAQKEFYRNSSADTILTIDGPSTGFSGFKTFYYSIGVTSPTKQIEWLKSFSDSTNETNQKGFDIIDQSTIKQYGIKYRILDGNPRKVDSLEFSCPKYKITTRKKRLKYNTNLYSLDYSFKLQLGNKLLFEKDGFCFHFISENKKGIEEQEPFKIAFWESFEPRLQIWMIICYNAEFNYKTEELTLSPKVYFVTN